MFTALGFLLSIILIVQAYTSYPSQELYQFPNNTFTHIENIAVRSNGQLLLTLITAPEVYLFSASDKDPSPQLLHKFPNATSLTGIVEIAPDVFAILVGNYTYEKYQGVPGSFSVWSIDMNLSKPQVRKVGSVAGAHALNGMTAVDGSPDMVLIADSALGAIWSMNVTNGKSQIAVQDPHLGPTATFPLGVNGIRSQGRTMYFTNSAKGFFGSFAISQTGQREGNISIIAQSNPGDTFDDFAIDGHGNAWITNHPNAVIEVTSRARKMTVANSTDFVGPTAAAFGRGHCQSSCILYIVTGGQASNTSITSGQVFALNTCN